MEELEGIKLANSNSLIKFNDKIRDDIGRILTTPFFRYFKIDFDKKCPFWDEPMQCLHEHCAVKVTSDEVILEKLKSKSLSEVEFPDFIQDIKLFGSWDTSRSDNFCQFDRGFSKGVFVDLIDNPERFTGYNGPSAAKIWSFIYNHSCSNNNHYILKRLNTEIWDICSEKTLFTKIVSGLHASISTHIADQFYNKITGFWDKNQEMFFDRVGNYPERIQNMFLVYVFLLKAVTRNLNYLSTVNYSCSSNAQDENIKVTQAFIFRSSFCNLKLLEICPNGILQ